MTTFWYPDSLTYLIVKICVLMVALLIWLVVTAEPAV